MSIIHKIDIHAPRATVFALYEDVASWHRWDSETEAVHLPEGLRPGAVGWLKPRKGPKATIEISEVVQGKSFTVLGRLPLCQMHFGHELQSNGGYNHRDALGAFYRTSCIPVSSSDWLGD